VCSVSDPDPCGSAFIWLPWIRIRIGNTDLDPDPGQSKWRLKRGKIRDFKLKRALSNMLKARWFLCTWAWKSSIYVFIAFCDWKKKNLNKKISWIMVSKNLDPNPDPYWPQMLDPDPYWDQYGSETLLVCVIMNNLLTFKYILERNLHLFGEKG